MILTPNVERKLHWDNFVTTTLKFIDVMICGFYNISVWKFCDGQFSQSTGLLGLCTSRGNGTLALSQLSVRLWRKWCVSVCFFLIRQQHQWWSHQYGMQLHTLLTICTKCSCRYWKGAQKWESACSLGSASVWKPMFLEGKSGIR